MVTDSAYFVSTVSNETILDNEFMLSCDVEPLFTNVPIDAAVQAALQKLENHPSLTDHTTLTPAQIDVTTSWDKQKNLTFIAIHHDE